VKERSVIAASALPDALQACSWPLIRSQTHSTLSSICQDKVSIRPPQIGSSY